VRRAATIALASGCIAIAAGWFPRAWCGRDAAAWLAGDLEVEDALARTVASDLARGVTAADFQTGSSRFDGEWSLVTTQMAVLGLAQVVDRHPERRATYAPLLERAGRRLVAPSLYRFGAEAYGEDPLGASALASDSGHAYLGYGALALGMVRRVSPHTSLATAHDALVAALGRRLSRAPRGLIETYPGESYPADVAAAAGAIGLHARVTGRRAPVDFGAWSSRFRETAIDRASGLLVQSADAETGATRDSGRASGTALAIYFLSFVDRRLSHELYRALVASCGTSVLGFGAIREYPLGRGGGGDIDSGPVIAGLGLSASGFAIGGARIHRDRDTFVGLVRSASFFGVPVARNGGAHYLAGGRLGNAILLAMLTAEPLR